MTAPDDGALADQVVGEAARDLVELLLRTGTSLATAESLTGGLLGAAVTAVPGASKVYRGGVIAYASDLKHELLGVDAQLLRRVGAVDPQVARAMADGVRRRLGADYGLATTGVAGPAHQDGKPPGTVWLGLATARQTLSAGIDAPGERADVRRGAVLHALRQLQALVQAQAGTGDGATGGAQIR